MNFSEYQSAATRTANAETAFGGYYPMAAHALGLTGEAGEVADLIKKNLAHGHTLDTEKLVYELGDVLWYISALATDFGFDLTYVAERNIEKLKRRYQDKFSVEASVNRKD